jgi:hypothetical protein
MLPDHDVTIVERAITLDQVKEYHLEETAQPTKWKNEDGRLNTHAPRFAREYGKDALSYELDALPAPVLRQLVREAIQEHVSKEEHEEALAEQEEDRLELRNRVERMRNGDDDPEYAWE